MSEESQSQEDWFQQQAERKKVIAGVLFGFAGSAALIAFIWVLHAIFGSGGH